MELGNKQIVILTLDGVEYGIDMDRVSNIEKPFEMYKVPGVPPYIEGISDIRGKVHTIINLRKKFGLPVKDMGEETRIIVTEVHSSLVGLLVDSASSIITVDEENIETCEGHLDGTYPEYVKKFIRGMVRTPAGYILMLDPDLLALED
jgi:purine-binding chemotaxis protein CheW